VPEPFGARRVTGGGAARAAIAGPAVALSGNNNRLDWRRIVVLPGHTNAFVSTGHGMLGVTLGPASGRAVAEFVRTGRRPEVLEPFRFDR
jgi:glycine/D-amino acid oxidase-like deaminating enzyme